MTICMLRLTLLLPGLAADMYIDLVFLTGGHCLPSAVSAAFLFSHSASLSHHFLSSSSSSLDWSHFSPPFAFFGSSFSGKEERHKC